MTQLLGCGTDDCLLCRSEFLGHCGETGSCSMIGVSGYLQARCLSAHEGTSSIPLRAVGGGMGRPFSSDHAMPQVFLLGWLLLAERFQAWDELLKPCHLQYADACCVAGSSKEMGETLPTFPDISAKIQTSEELLYKGIKWQLSNMYQDMIRLKDSEEKASVRLFWNELGKLPGQGVPRSWGMKN